MLSGEDKSKTGDEDAGVLQKRKQFEDVAVSGEDMVKFAGVSWVSNWLEGKEAVC